MRFRPIIFEFTLLKRTFFATTPPQFDDKPSFSTLAFGNGLAYRNFGFRKGIDDHFVYICKNLVRFGSLTPGFKT